MSFILVCCIHSYLVGPSRGHWIQLLQVTTSIMRLKKLYPIMRQKSGLYTKSDREGVMPQRIAGLVKKIWSILLSSCEPISLSMGFGLFDLFLTSSAGRFFRGMPCTLQVLLSESVGYE